MRIELWRKDVVPAGVTSLKATDFRQSYITGDGNKIDGIIPCEAVVSFYVNKAQVEAGIDYRDFIVEFDDEWQVIAYSDNQTVFVGFLVPGEGEADFKDFGYELTLSATDGIGFLKQQPLSTFDAAEFTGVHYLIDYIKKCLSYTKLDLPIRAYVNIFEQSMVPRHTDSSKDMFQQCGMHYRSFLKDPTTFDNCFDVLNRIFFQHFSFYQWKGEWVINRIAEMQETAGPQNWYTRYETDGSIEGDKEYETMAKVARGEKLHPINANQRISSKFPVKSVQHTFPYEPWPEIPANNKFERGTLSIAYSGVDYSAYILDEWTYMNITGPSSISALPGVLGFATDPAYRKSTFDDFGIETIRELALYGSGAGARWLQSQPVPVNKNDKIELRFDFRTENDQAAIQIGAMVIYIQPPTGPRYSLRWNPTLSEGRWIAQPGTGADLAEVRVEFAADEDTRQYKSVSMTSAPFPIDGDMYVVFIHPAGFFNNQFVYFTGFELTYLPFTAGGFRKIVGDYWLTLQNQPYKDVVQEEVGASDSLKKVLKGSLYDFNLIELTTPTWYRDYIDRRERRHYKELLNLGVYNHRYRRQWRISGSFGGTKHSPVSDPTIFEPLSFHRHFEFVDAPELLGIYFMLVPPLSIDWREGQFDGTFVDCLNVNNSVIGGNSVNDVIDGLIDAVYEMTEADWDAAGNAPPIGTPAFPPYIGYIPDAPTQLLLGVPLGVDVTVNADANGAGNSPVFVIISSSEDAINRTVRLEIGTDIAVGNRFSIEIFGVPVTFQVAPKYIFTDGNEEGDTHKFSYQF